MLRYHGLNQDQVARSMNVSPCHVTDILNGTTATYRAATYKKMIAGLRSLSVTAQETSKLFVLR
jgi:transcriptional regulator with XRE-family HTH domain